MGKHEECIYLDLNERLCNCLFDCKKCMWLLQFHEKEPQESWLWVVKKKKTDLKKVLLFMHFLLQIKIQRISRYPDKELRTNFWKHTEGVPTSHRLNKN